MEILNKTIYLYIHIRKDQSPTQKALQNVYNIMISNEILETEAATRCVLLKKVFLEISQNSQANICARVSFLTGNTSGTGAFL